MGMKAYPSNSLIPIPYAATVRTSTNGHAAGPMNRVTFYPAGRWWNTSSRFSVTCWPAIYRARPCANTATTSGRLVGRSSESCRWTALSVDARSSRSFSTSSAMMAGRYSLTISRKPSNARLMRPVASSSTSLQRPRAPVSTESHEPQTSLMAPMPNSWPCVSRSSPVAALRGAEGAGLDGDPHGRDTIERANRCGRHRPATHSYPQFPLRNLKFFGYAARSGVFPCTSTQPHIVLYGPIITLVGPRGARPLPRTFRAFWTSGPAAAALELPGEGAYHHRHLA